MSDQDDQARFAAREFVARWARETGEGEGLSAVVTDRMLFAYEMGFLRGWGVGAKHTSQLLDDVSHDREKGEDDDESK